MKLTHAIFYNWKEKAGIHYARRYLRRTLSNRYLTGLDLGDEVYVGLFVGSHNADVLETGCSAT